MEHIVKIYRVEDATERADFNIEITDMLTSGWYIVHMSTATGSSTSPFGIAAHDQRDVILTVILAKSPKPEDTPEYWSDKASIDPGDHIDLGL